MDGSQIAIKPRVLFLIENVPFRLDTRVQRQADVVQRLGGRAVVICPTDGSGVHRIQDGVSVYQYPKPSFGPGFAAHLAEYATSMFFHFFLTLWVFIRHGFDVIHSANPPDMFWIIAAPYKLLGKIYIFDHHDLVPELFQVRYGHKFPAIVRAVLWMERMGMRLADHVISTNKTFRSIAVTRGGKQLNQVTIVRNGPWLARDFPDVVPDGSVRELGDVVIGYLGIMNPQDHLDNLLRAAKTVRQDFGRSDIGFLLIGQGDAYSDLLKLRDDLGLTEAVRMTGVLPWKRVLGCLAAVDICVQPDLPTPFNLHLTMNKLMEYMALGKPAIAYDMPETRASGGDAIFYINGTDTHALATAIVELADNPSLRGALGLAAKHRVETELAWEHQMESLANVYRQAQRQFGLTRESVE
jgi:glycosyltransferase involved in cell wall biosynthesis